MTYNLIIVDDHKMFLDGLLSILSHEKDYHILLTAQDGRHIVKYLEVNPNEKIDLIITDISMPELGGIELNHIIKQHHNSIKTLVVSMHNDAHMINTLIDQDVDGYVPKNAEKEVFLKAIKTIVNGEKYFPEAIKAIYLDNKFSQKQQEAITLTQREIDVITLIAEECTSQEIADKLFLSKHTIESYRKNIMSKLQVKNLAGLTKYALKKGYTNYDLK
ncbi:response regulator transcription factor [Tamlana sp. s12]|uniref:response regulator n=1 Tax=Tamlana sp. s12 TaxID=1630406 RepID=UPI0007FCC5A8|nr:response regulator transcription factor [Tamlana sp. s12]OBQ56918.1 regulator [Tamlana sp. s12]QQY82911.1 response regulator transcription factor [Tamlana sp. s12]